ncbi:nucleotidyltransferase domain-containing protein [Bacillus sp. JJ1773]|uniref:nucleotidyltransferase domain-containing protein n=1 Tax=Bacillus sp. JJ1773 TaxID=3122965 RepID=UPI002FFF8C7A
MDIKVPITVQKILNEYMSLFNARIPDTLEGIYLHGSIALNSYKNGSSDIDFIAIVNRHFTEEEVKILSKIHRELINKYKNTIMDGCYLLWEDIGKKKTETKKCLYVYEGKVGRSNHVINPITWWILREKGISIIGPEITSFHFEVDKSDLVDYVLKNMNTYWLNRLKTIERFNRIVHLLPNKLVDWEVQWSITGVLRQFYTLREHKIISKVDACNYAIKYMPESLHNIVKESISIREGLNIRYCDSKKQRINDTIQCMKYIIDYSS